MATTESTPSEARFGLFLISLLVSALLFAAPLAYAQVGTAPETPNVPGAAGLSNVLFALPNVGRWLLQVFDSCLDIISVSLLFADSLTSSLSFVVFALTVYPLVSLSLTVLDLTLLASALFAPLTSLCLFPCSLCTSLLSSSMEASPLNLPMPDIVGILSALLMGVNLCGQAFTLMVSIAGQFGGLVTGAILMFSRLPVPLLDSCCISLGRVVYLAAVSSMSSGYLKRSVAPLQPLLSGA